MEVYGKILIIAMPCFLALIIIEKLYGYFKGVDHAPLMDSVSSISSGVTNATKDVLGLSITILTYEWMVSKMALFTIQESALAYIVAFIAIDFQGYWTHRWAHQINIFWNKHAIHHSSEEFNLSCALRQSVSQFFNLFTFLLLPAALLGVPAKVIAITLPIQFFVQFWYHTRYINKMGFLEKIIVTPSHHRVHHAINPEYMDKNHSQVFIIWDKLFGTFQEELSEVPAVFGITRPAETWNPFKINFQHLWVLIRDAWRAEKFSDKLRIWFMPTGWRPEGFDEKYPIHKIDNVYNFQKFGTNNSKTLIGWSIAQLLLTLLLISYFFDNIAIIGIPGIFIYGLFVFVTVYSYSELMDKNKYAFVYEGIRYAFAIAIVYLTGSWFKIDDLIPYGTIIVMSYLTLCLLISIYFVTVEFKETQNQPALS
ncbi:sterol desaturase family protein [Flavobacterium terrae]|uniref:Sterol desaturase/sphingolipid hydroxylase, fatty acid hydroxylase superfamily n=1 Tax=Flavobacterium terrae TaxID=415425 RepID=A0A1M6GGL3_9FLAO|nr:sterol desaturase family protein [Flavobacterium terrae]SHJ09003.1 Sterol desaturase/sphingolipid hydroxylase, fatty acid hydroxylase superfamily [Flavobacterium terrae]